MMNKFKRLADVVMRALTFSREPLMESVSSPAKIDCCHGYYIHTFVDGSFDGCFQILE